MLASVSDAATERQAREQAHGNGLARSLYFHGVARGTCGLRIHLDDSVAPIGAQCHGVAVHGGRAAQKPSRDA